MADQEPLDTTSQDVDQLPERIRVHALAKRLGVTSKRILAKLSELGSEARSPQSNVERSVAETVRDSLRTPPIPSPPDAGESPAGAATPGGEEPGRHTEAVVPKPGGGSGQIPETVTDAQTPTPAAAEDESAAEAESASPEAAEAVPQAAAHSTPTFTAPFTAPAGLFASPVPEEPTVAEPVVFETAVAAPLFLPPDTKVAEELRRRRRAERATNRSEEPTGTDTEDETVAEGRTEEQAAGEEQPRRRRRGRRGRGRGRGEQHTENETGTEQEGSAAESGEPATDTETVEERSAEPADTETTEQDESGDTETGASAEPNEGTPSRRRRRRRRRKAGESGETEPADDDPPNTVVHEREPRNKSRGRAVVDEVQGIAGSTRLEAKRQRRRDGREAGRRRPPILTESEFLARRESVDRVMVVREKAFPGHPTATQVAVLEDNILVEHFVTSTGSASMVGNVYLGKVQNVLPSMEAAFVDIGRGRNGVLYAGEVDWEAAGLGGKERKIEQALKPGDQVLVQVSKDPVGHKGARLTTQISLAGRFLVYVPGGTSTGISRKLPDTERKRLKEILREIVPDDAGVIIRTAAEGVSETELTRDVERLQTTWRKIKEAAGKDSGAPKTLYEEPDLLVKVVRDLFNEDFSKLVIEGERSWSTVQSYIGTVAPDLLDRVIRHENNGVDVFEAYRIDEQLAKALDRKVWLPSGGTLVIDRTEAMTVIDVNTGKFTGSGGGNLEETVTRNNLEAAEEIVRQMRLRDIGGMIVVDFIDMVLESNRDLVLRRLTEALGRDRTRHQVSEVTSLGLVQMTRKKLGTGLVEAFSTTCEHCHGRGIVVHSYPVEPSSAEDGAGRGRESGSRRRRGRDKSAAPATPAAPVTESTGEDAAVKRAHPVALAMAAHQAEEADGRAEGSAESVDTAEVAAEAVVSEAVVSEVIEAVQTGDTVVGSEPESAEARFADERVVEEAVAAPSSGGATGTATSNGVSTENGRPAQDRPAGDEPPPPRQRRRRRVVRSAAAPDSVAGRTAVVGAEPVSEVEAGDDSATVLESAPHASGSATAVTGAETTSVEAAPTGDEPTPAAVEEVSPAVEPSGAESATTESTTTESTSLATGSAPAGAGDADAVSAAVEPPARPARRRAARPAAAPVAGAQATVVSVEAVGHGISRSDGGASETVSVEEASADAETAAVTAVESADGTAATGTPSDTAEPSPAADSVAVASGAEDAAVRPARRRRVARSAAAPSPDSSGAVFVLSASEQSSAPAVDFTSDVTVTQVQPSAQRTRRRGAGRPAGPPAEEKS
ncbi:translation initiation factor IF-2 N-terminal domain-containing protein [Nocardia paucivorans]|uniref:translation initiation factor IF-2 N-terminal domain-containing protein n=1 Tax=Nocardia paucivorans TaxID=114259 RepID=UPI0002F810E3